MENTSIMVETVEKVKNTIINMKNPLKNNLSKINEILNLFDKTTIALINPIKKLKISYASKINSLLEFDKKGKYFLVLKYFLIFLEKEGDRDNNNEVNKIDSENSDKIKLEKFINYFVDSLDILSNLYNTDAFNKLNSFSQNLNAGKKKAKKKNRCEFGP